MERPKIIVLLTVLRSLECVKNHFPSHLNELERFWTCQKQLNSYRDESICNDVNATENTEISSIAYAVETPRGEHPSLQSKRSLPAVNSGPGQPTDSPWPLLYAVLITTVSLLAIYLQNSATYCGISDSRRRNKCGRQRRSPLIPGRLKIPWYVTFHGKKKLAVQARNITAGKK